MYELEITKQFSGAHSLTGYPGDCRKLHGHNWQVTVYLQANKLDEIGIALDFKILKKELNEVIDRFADMPICSGSKVTSCPEQIRNGLIELRKKLDAAEATVTIKAVYGFGYKLTEK